MSGATLVVFVGVLVALLLGMLALLVWQEGRRRTFDTMPEYVVDQLHSFIESRLDPAVAERLGRDGVERVVNWELRYLQRDGGEGAVAGGTDVSVAYIVDRIAQFHGVTYPQSDVRAVLALEAEYLMAAGAVGEPVAKEGEGEA
jgi:hypothetical protein